MKNNQIVFYLSKEVSSNGRISFELKHNQIGCAFELNLGVEKIDFSSNTDILKIERALRDVIRAALFDMKLEEGIERDYKVLFKNEYSVTGLVKRSKYSNYEKRWESFNIPFEVNEIMAFGKAFFNTTLFDQK